jgi:hypothetical protein
MAFSTITHIEHQLYRQQWELNKDASRDLVKQQKTKYLPMNNLPDSALTTPENVQMNEFIKHKYNTQIWPMSVFYNFTRPTIGAWVGLIMAKKPTISFTDVEDGETKLDYLLKNADGGGNGIVTLAKLALEATIETGGGCFYLSPPSGGMTEQSIRDGSSAPFIKYYDRNNILNWETKFVGGRKQLTYIKLREWEFYSKEDSSERIEKHIEFFLIDGAVTYKVTRDKGYEDAGYPALEEGAFVVNSKQVNSIPVFWFGANDNDESVDPAPITPIAALNVLHYVMFTRDMHQRYDAGQAQYHIDHGTQQQVQIADENGKLVSIVEFMNPGGIKIGSSAAIHTINGGKAEILQAKTDSLLATAPTEIEERAQKIGAQMLVESSITTATEANLSYGASTSNLVTIADNVGMALKAVIELVADWVGYTAKDKIQFELNKKLVTVSMSPQEIQTLWQAVLQGVHPMRAYFWQMQQAGKVPTEWTFETFMAEIEEDQGRMALAGVGTPQM